MTYPVRDRAKWTGELYNRMPNRAEIAGMEALFAFHDRRNWLQLMSSGLGRLGRALFPFADPRRW